MYLVKGDHSCDRNGWKNVALLWNLAEGCVGLHVAINEGRWLKCAAAARRAFPLFSTVT